MRIAVINWSRRKVGGVESYLEHIIPELHAGGHQVAFWHELDEPLSRKQIELPHEVSSWCVAEVGVRHALDALREWHPDLLYTHRLLDFELERETLLIAPAVYFAHDYNGACLSGSKTFQLPKVRPCSRKFDWKCFLHYYPHRCGGSSPITMVSEYRRQSKRQKILRAYQNILTNSDYVRDELIRYGLVAERVYLPVGSQVSPIERSVAKPWQLLFLGRMTSLKGGNLLIDALPEISAALQLPIQLTLAGDGPERKNWEHRATRVQSTCKNIGISFTGWVDESKRNDLLNNSDLMVVPSLWPEPFGLVGLEAGSHGVPSVAFAVGGIPEWLFDGINGFLALGDTPTTSGLAEAIIKALSNCSTYENLKRGAVEVAQRFSMENHINTLVRVFEKVLADPHS